jgi:hypothetical protein
MVTTERGTALAAGNSSNVDFQRTGRIFGWFFIGTFVFSIPAVLLYSQVLKTNYVLGLGGDHRVALGAFLELLLAVCNIATAVVLFPIAKRWSEKVALGYVASRVVESTIIVMGAISLLSIVTLRHALATTKGADPHTYVTVGRSLVAFHDWTFLIGPTFLAGVGNGILLGYLMFRSGLVPRPWAVLGLVGGALCIVGTMVRLFATTNGHTTTLASLLVAPEIVWEAFLGIYCAWKGFRPESPLAQERSSTLARS